MLRESLLFVCLPKSALLQHVASECAANLQQNPFDYCQHMVLCAVELVHLLAGAQYDPVNHQENQDVHENTKLLNVVLETL